MIIEKLKLALKKAIKDKSEDKSSIRVIIGEIERDPNKDYTDTNILKILKRLRKTTLKSPKPDEKLVIMIDKFL